MFSCTLKFEDNGFKINDYSDNIQFYSIASLAVLTLPIVTVVFYPLTVVDIIWRLGVITHPKINLSIATTFITCVAIQCACSVIYGANYLDNWVLRRLLCACYTFVVKKTLR